MTGMDCEAVVKEAGREAVVTGIGSAVAVNLAHYRTQFEGPLSGRHREASPLLPGLVCTCAEWWDPRRHLRQYLFRSGR